MKVKKLFYNRKFNIVLSLVLAVLLWLIVVINVSPDYKRTIYGVPITVDESNSQLTELKLHVVDKSASTVNVQVTGPRSLIGELSAKDFSITPDLTSVDGSGSYKLNLSISTVKPQRVHIMSIRPQSVTIRFDTIDTETFPVEAQVESSQITEGYLMQSAAVTPQDVTVSGPKNELSRVEKAVIYVKVPSGADSTCKSTQNIVLLDSAGRQVDAAHMTMDRTKADVTVPILKTRKVPLKINFTNIPKGISESDIVCDVSPAKLLIAGDKNRIEEISKIDLDSVDFESLGTDTSMSLKVPSIDGVVNVDNIDSANVRITLRGIGESTMNCQKFIIVNQPAGYSSSVLTSQISGIKVMGPSAGLGGLGSITAVVDMSKIAGAGQYEIPVSIQFPGVTGYWAQGTYKAVVKVQG